jgi:imidazolonepropionase-like amidohydrolase
MNKLSCVCLFIAVVSVSARVNGQADGSSRQEEGLRENTPSTWVIKGARVVDRPGSVIEDAVLVIRDGKFVSVRGSEDFPPDHRVVDLTGKTIYPGLIDGWREVEVVISESPDHARYWNSNIRPERDVTSLFAFDEKTAASLRKAGITSAVIAPGAGIFKGSAALVLSRAENPAQNTVVPRVAQAMELTVARRFGGGGPGGVPAYPSSPMGAVALARQAMYDARWYVEAWKVARGASTVSLPELNESLEAMRDAIAGKQKVVIKTSNELMALRADRFAKEFELDLVILGSGNEYRRLADIVATKRAVIVPLQFPAAPNVGTPEDELEVSLEQLMHWDLAPENPARLAKEKVPFAFTAGGLKDPADYLAKVRQAVVRGLDTETALAAMTTVPARLFNAESRLGTIESGKMANLIVTDGDLFAEETKILESWVAGNRYEFDKEPAAKPAGVWSLIANEPANDKNAEERVRRFELTITGEKAEMSGRIRDLDAAIEPADEPDAESKPAEGKDQQNAANNAAAGENSENKLAEPAQEAGKAESVEKKPDGTGIKDLALNGMRLTGSFPAADVKAGEEKTDNKEPETADKPDVIRFSILFAPGSKSATGTIQWPSGVRVPLTVEFKGEVAARENEDGSGGPDDAPKEGGEKDDGKNGDSRGKGKGKGGESSYARGPALYEPNFPLGRYGVHKAPEEQTVLFRGMTIWTCAESGVLLDASVLVENGRIKAIFRNGESLPDVKNVVSGEGLHLTPGIIDCHSHMATDSGVNEGAQAVTAEVRIGDFIDCDDITIFRQLAGGVTASNILHGSANTIGGQNQVVKLRWGLNDEQMKFAEAPAGIKFALGENVKDRSGSAYPSSRMGVEQLLHDSFRAARQYRQRHAEWNESREGLPPRHDLELEALAEIVEGKRWIHCHSYRQDEILALLRTLEEYGITIGTLQHILEGYKVADKMAEHGAMASAFADWWAYKFEVYDAIPYAGAMMHKAGVVVSFNSDDGELATHLNHEAAKAVKYGGVPPEEALKFVTLNPAKQLRVEKLTGSIETGKHADIVVWNGPPLSVYSRVLQTWIDGRMYFSSRPKEEDPDTRKMYAGLVQKVLKSGEKMGGDEEPTDPQDSWLRHDEYCGAHLYQTDAANRMKQLLEAWENEESNEDQR